MKLRLRREAKTDVPTCSKRAERDLADLPEALQVKARAVIARLDAEPGLGKKLVGQLTGLRSARLGRAHRIIYEVRNDGRAHVLTVRPRKDAYR